ncbi:MAG: SDR family oxidoreductase [Planctomycetes bacterium]|nr:SDR family oxidoreductase [Planctomycetota bacterium]
MSDFLQLAGKNILVMGAANKKSVAWYCGRVLEEAGARAIHCVRNAARQDEVGKLLDKERGLKGSASNVFKCDVENQKEIDALAAELAKREIKLDGIVHSIAFANYAKGFKSFHETAREDFLQAVNVSCFSLMALSNALKPLLNPGAGVVTIGISDTRMAAENYGYMAPIKAALHSAVVFLAKSFADARVRFNAVGPSLLKTSASAGIPDYMDSYLYAEMATLRHEALKTEEVANVVVFLLSPRSSGINAQHVVIDAGMSTNYFDKAVVKKATQ